MSMPRGVRLQQGEEWSARFEGYIAMPDGRFRIRKYFNERRGHQYGVNHYYSLKACTFCGEEHLQHVANEKKAKNPFCSRACFGRYSNAQVQGKRYVKKREHGEGNHILIKNSEHSRSGRHGVVYEHILVAEKTLGRPIEKTERVHHINCIKDDNRPENLFVCATDKEHFKVHGSLNRCVADLIDMGVLRFNKETRSYEVVK